MSREIKFRAWDGEQMRENVCLQNGKTCSWEQSTALATFPGGGWRYAEKDWMLMQYTGRKDKNGVEIYEKDYLQNESGRIAVVNWHEIAVMFDCEPVVIVSGDNCDGFKPDCWGRWITKIGNSYENPELLQGE